MSATLALIVYSAALAAQPATLRSESQGYTVRLQVGAPDPSLAQGPTTPAEALAMLPPGRPGAGPGNPPPAMQARARTRGGGGGAARQQVGPVTLLEIGKPTHAFRLTVEKAPRGAALERARVVAVETETYDVSVAAMRRLDRTGEFGGNVVLPGAGPYKVVARMLTKDGAPVVFKFDLPR
ncbi:MAG: hypothetical protein FJZ01_07990 [Candidatus Sericytochromatia bacterium]|nr:hypothetical protein [Candidatus Tanganyikabacteria bacterium]